jgi:acetylornithine deacetylase/succinyl-diaminopimelate desuccinylase-like protein
MPRSPTSAIDFNRSPERAILQGTRRHDVDEDLAGVERGLRDLVVAVEAWTGVRIDLRVQPIAEAFDVDPSDPIVEATRDAHRELFGTELPIRRSRVATNAVHFVQEARIPAVCYGPDHATNHSDRESLEVRELARLAGGYALASARWFERMSGAASPRR